MLGSETNNQIKVPPVPSFSIGYMDTSVDPHEDFFRYSVGQWISTNQVPADKASWSAFDELLERNLYILRRILEDSANDTFAEFGSTVRLVGNFYKSAMDLERIEKLEFQPVLSELHRVEETTSGEDLAHCIAELHTSGVHSFFTSYSKADKKNSTIYAAYLDQGGLSLPDREYYLNDSFKEVRDSFRLHLARMFQLAGENEETSKGLAELVLAFETHLADGSRPRADLRDEEKNYNKIATADLDSKFPFLDLSAYLEVLGVPTTEFVIVGQPEFFTFLDKLLSRTPIENLRTYLRWCVLHSRAPYLHSAVEAEDFDFFHRKLMGQQQPEIRPKIGARVIDEFVGEALGSLYVEKHFPPEARKRVALLIEDIRSVFRERLGKVPWMTALTRQEALVKFEKFNVKIGHPDRFRDYASLLIDPTDFLGNVRRSSAFEARRQASRVGKLVDRSEWLMTPPTVNAYFSPTENEIVFPAGILQPPFFDLSMDDAVNYAGIGAVIGHEITHGYDDQGRKFDGSGTLRDWWTPEDEREFKTRATTIAKLYGTQEPLPGVHVNGELTLGENIADFGGISIAFEALQRRLSLDPEKQQEKIDGLSQEQRFFIAWAQIWRMNVREEELRRLLTIDPHAPNRYRATLPATNHPSFEHAFPLKENQTTQTRNLIGVW